MLGAFTIVFSVCYGLVRLIIINAPTGVGSGSQEVAEPNPSSG